MSFTGSSFSRFTRNYLIIFGSIFFVIGIVVIVMLGGIPYAGGGMLLMGGIFALVGGGIVVAGFLAGRSASATDSVLASGIAGMATITGVTQTGMYLNDQPRIKLDLLVQLPGQAPYAAEHSEFVPLILLYRVQPGATLPVRVNPAEPQKVAIDWNGPTQPMQMPMPGAPMAPMAAPPMPGSPIAGGLPPAAPGSGMTESMAQVQAALASTGAAVPAAYATPDQANYTVEQLREWLRTNGVQAQARVDFLQDEGKIVGSDRMYVMEMTLFVPGSAPEKLQRSVAMVPLTAMPRLFQGMTLPVAVAAENHQLLTVEWDKV